MPAARIAQLDVNRPNVWTAVVEEERTDIDDFVSNSDGLKLIGAFMRIDNAAVRRRIVMLVREIAGDDGN